MTETERPKQDDNVSTRVILTLGGCLPATIALILGLLTCANWWPLCAAIRRWLEV